MSNSKLIGPFKQLVTLNHLPLKGALKDEQLELIADAGILVENGFIRQIGAFNDLVKVAKNERAEIEEINTSMVLLPGFVDPHTHICWAGSRAGDYALRLNGASYLEIAQNGGGIRSTVEITRKTSESYLIELTAQRIQMLEKQGITTIEIKSGYGLNTAAELKMLRVIKDVAQKCHADLVPTCLAAHVMPFDFSGTAGQYLQKVVTELLPEIKKQNLTQRVDAYVDTAAFNPEVSAKYLTQAKELNFDITVHADQFTIGGSELACKLGALSADHLEVSGDAEIKMLAQSQTIPVALPASSLGLGHVFAPARKLLNAGASLAIGSDWNPGSAPMGDLLVGATVLGTYEKLTTAETLAAITFRAAAALGLYDRGILAACKLADMVAFETDHFYEILYHQGKLKPVCIWKKGNLVS